MSSVGSVGGGPSGSSALVPLVVIALLAATVTAVSLRAEVGAQEASGEVEIEIERLTTSAFGRGTTATIQGASTDGRYVVFRAGDRAFTNEDEPTGKNQAFLVDRQSGDVELISRAADGTPSGGGGTFNSGHGADVSDDGRYVVYGSVADDIVPVDPENDDTVDQVQPWKVFLHDRDTAETRVVSRAPDGVVVGGDDPSISGDGSLVVFTSHSDRLSDQDDNGAADLYLYDVAADAFTLISAATDGTATGQLASGDTPQISGDGSTVVYTSNATNHVDPPTTRHTNVFAWDVATETTRLVSETPDGTEHDGSVIRPRVSENGRHVAFLENGPLVDGVRQPSNLDDTDDPTRDLVVKDLASGEVTVATVPPGTDDAQLSYPTFTEADISLDGDGSRVAFTAQGGGSWDATDSRIFVHDLDAGVTFPLHEPAPRDHTNRPLLTGDGLEVVFDTKATGLADGPDTGDARTLMASQLTEDTLPAGSTERLVFGLSDPSDGLVYDVATTPDGRFVAFTSDATDLLDEQFSRSNRTHVYLLDRDTGQLELLDVDEQGEPVCCADGVKGIDITPDGRYVAFVHKVDLDPDPSTVDAGDMVFVLDRDSGTTQQVSRDETGEHIAGRDPSISHDGRYVTYSTTHLAVADDDNGSRDVVVHDRDTGENLVASRHTDGTLSDGFSVDSHVSGDGSTVVFESTATNLVDVVGDASRHIYAHDLATRETTLVSVLADGITPSDGTNDGPRITPDARHVVFAESGRSGAHNLDPDDDGSRDMIVKDRETGALEIVSIAPDADVEPDWVEEASIAPDGRHVSFIAQGSGSWDSPSRNAVYVRDRDAGVTVNMTRPDSVGTTLFPRRQAITGDGRSTYFRAGQLWVTTQVDSTGPTWPADAIVTASDVGQTVATLSWDPASDDVGVDAYRLLQDGTQVAEVDGGTLSTTVTGLTADTTYAFTIVAVDAAGNATPGPSTDVTTQAGDTLATLLADADPGGVVSLTWDPAASPPDAYRIQRDDGTGFAPVADVGGDVTTFDDTDLPADTTFTYRIDVVDGATVSAHTDTAVVMTSALDLEVVTWDGPRNRARRILLDSDVVIEAFGEPNRAVTATVTIESWYDAADTLLTAPIPRTVDVPLGESTSGAYEGLLPVVDGTARIVDVDATMSDGAGHEAVVSADGSPAAVTGTLTVSLDTSGGDTDGRITATHPTAYGAQVEVTGGAGPFPITALTPADGYDLRLLGPDGRLRALPEPPMDVLPGRTIDAELVVSLPADLTVEVTPADGGEPPQGTVTIVDADTGETLHEDSVHEGTAGPFELVSSQRITAHFAPSGVTLHGDAELTDGPLQLQAGDNLLSGDVPLAPTGALRGTVTDPDGNPINDGQVTYRYEHVGRRHEASTTSTDGTFDLIVPAGNGELELQVDGADPVAADVTVAASETTIQDLQIPRQVPLEIELDLFTQMPDGELVGPLPMSGREVYHFWIHVNGKLERGYPIQTTVPETDTTARVCADGREAGLPQACDDALIDHDSGTAHATIELVWPAAATATLIGSDGQPATETWTATVRQERDGTMAVVGRHQGSGPDLRLPLAALNTTFRIDVVTADGERTSVHARPTDPAPIVDLQDVALDGPGRFAGQPGNAVSILDVVPGPDGWMDVRVTLANAGSTTAEAGHLQIDIPAGTQPTVDSATVDGTTATSTIETNPPLVTTPLGDIAPGGTRTVRVRLPVPDRDLDPLLGLAAWIVTADAATELVGVDARPIDVVSLHVPPAVRDRTFPVSGAAVPGAPIRVVDEEGTVLASTTSDAAGRWDATLTLPDRGPWYRHRVRAELRDDDELTTTGYRAVELDETLPELTSLVMSQTDGRPITIELGDDPFQFPYVFAPGKGLTFEMTFDGADRIHEPIVVVGRSAARATRRDDGVYVASLTPHYSELGPIWVTFDRTLGEHIFDRPGPTREEIDSWNWWTAEPATEVASDDADTTSTAARLPSDGGLPTAGLLLTHSDASLLQVQDGTTTSKTFEGDHDLSAGGGTYEITISVTEVERELTEGDHATAAALGVPLYARTAVPSHTSTRVRMSLSFEVPRDLVADEDGEIDQAALRDLATGRLPAGVTMTDDGRIIARDGGVVRTTSTGLKLLRVGFEVAMAGDFALDTLAEIDGVTSDIAGLQARADSCEGAAGPGLRAAAHALQAANLGRLGFSFSGEAATLGLAASGIGALGAIGLGTLVWANAEALKWAVEAAHDRLAARMDAAFASDECEEEEEEEEEPPEEEPEDPLDPRDWAPTTPSGRWGKCVLLSETLEELDKCRDRHPEGAPPPLGEPTWIHDPSGYVFEAVPSNRLEGVTATLFEAPSPDGPWTVWDADWFGQQNPQSTDAEGRYGWDVPEGWWKVRYTVDGYLVGESDPLEVLPPHFDVNEGMIDPTAPTLADARVSSSGDAIDVVFDRYMITDDLDGTSVMLRGPDGTVVPTTLTFPDGELDLGGRLLATTVRLTPDAELAEGATYTVDVGAIVRSYAGTPMLADVTRGIPIEANSAPVAADDVWSATEDTTLTVDAAGVLANDTDPDGHPITAVLATGPTHGTVVLAPDGSFVYTPDPDASGLDTFTYVAHDGTDTSAEATVTIDVRPTNDPPRPVDDAYEVDGPLDVDAPGVLANDDDADGDALTVFIVTEPAQGTLVADGDGSFTYTPTEGYTGLDEFTYRVWDGQVLSDLATVTITVLAGNEAPVAGDDDVSTDEDTALSANVLANDTDADDDGLSVVAVDGDPADVGAELTVPSGGLLTVDADGAVTFDPNGAYEHLAPGESATVTLDYTVSDGEATDTATVTITIDGVDDAPTVTVTPASLTAQYSDGIVPVAVTATDVDSDSLTITLGRDAPSWATLIDGGCMTQDGGVVCAATITGTVTTAAGVETFSVVADDDTTSRGATVTIDVAPEDASVRLHGGNPVSIPVESDTGGGGGKASEPTSGSFELTARYRETDPDAGHAPHPGDLTLADPTIELVPVGPGDTVTGDCVATVGGDGYDQHGTLSCGFDDVPVNVYTVTATVDGDHWAGGRDGVLAVFDPTDGATTGSGTFDWPGTDDHTAFAYRMEHNKKGTNVKGAMLLVRETDDGDAVYQLDSNAIDGLAIGQTTGAGSYRWASFFGKTTYLQPGWDDPVGNHEFTIYVEDHPNDIDDRIWLQTRDKNDQPIPDLSMDTPAPDHATTLTRGQITIPEG